MEDFLCYRRRGRPVGDLADYRLWITQGKARTKEDSILQAMQNLLKLSGANEHCSKTSSINAGQIHIDITVLPNQQARCSPGTAAEVGNYELGLTMLLKHRPEELRDLLVNGSFLQQDRCAEPIGPFDDLGDEFLGQLFIAGRCNFAETDSLAGRYATFCNPCNRSDIVRRDVCPLEQLRAGVRVTTDLLRML